MLLSESEGLKEHIRGGGHDTQKEALLPLLTSCMESNMAGKVTLRTLQRSRCWTLQHKQADRLSSHLI